MAEKREPPPDLFDEEKLSEDELLDEPASAEDKDEESVQETVEVSLDNDESAANENNEASKIDTEPPAAPMKDDDPTPEQTEKEPESLFESSNTPEEKVSGSKSEKKV